MSLIPSEFPTRRAFLRRSTQLGLAGTALPFAINLAAMGEAAAFNATDYKALVCVFLTGGNDYANTVVTYDDPSYARYNTIRGSIALAKSDLAATLLNPTTPLPNGRQYALHPSMTGLAGLFNSGKAAVQLNVGPLVVPLTRAQYNSTDRITYPRPPRLFSHNDQVSVWQSSSPEGSTVGWGGNMGDLAQSSNGNSLFTCISLAGNSVLLSGDSTLQYNVSTAGSVSIDGIKNNVYGSTAVRAALTSLIQQSSTQTLEKEYNRVTARAIAAEGQITSGLAGVTLNTQFATRDSIAEQLKMVARLIGARTAMGSKRQVFMVGLGGFDLHDNLISQQPLLLKSLSDAMTAFYNATVELGVADKVTAFTASEFGRSLSSNGDGSDHGWGGHHLIVGGAVKGKAFYGSAPPVSVTNTAAAEDQWHVGNGSLLPSTSVDQYAATLGKWFGVTDAEMPSVLPNLVHFGTGAGRPDYPVNLGFMS